MKKNILLLASLALVITFTSCVKKKEVNYTTLATDSNIQQQMSADLTNNTNSQAHSGSKSGDVNKTDEINSSYAVLDTCAIVSLTKTNGTFPMTLRIDFGTGGCSVDGRVRKGILDLTFTGPYSTPHTVVTVVPTNYYVNDYKVEGTKTITNNGRNGAGHLTYTEVDANGKITKPDGGIITWSSTRTNVWKAGEGTAFWIFDDDYDVTGSANGLTSDGTTYDININANNPLEAKGSCLWVADKGTLTYTLNGSQTATLDCGNGVCRGAYTLTYNGHSYVVYPF